MCRQQAILQFSRDSLSGKTYPQGECDEKTVKACGLFWQVRCFETCRKLWELSFQEWSDGMWTIQEILQRVGFINHSEHKQAQALPLFFHHELMNVQRNLDPTVLFPCAEFEEEKDKKGEGWEHNNSFFCVLRECCLKAEEEVSMVCVSWEGERPWYRHRQNEAL